MAPSVSVTMTRVHECNSVHDMLGHDPLQCGRSCRVVKSRIGLPKTKYVEESVVKMDTEC